MYTICGKEFFDKAFKSKVFENGHSSGSVLCLDNGVGDGGRQRAQHSVKVHTLFVTVSTSLAPVGSIPRIVDSFNM